MAKVLVTIDDDLLARIDRAAARAGKSRSGFLTDIAGRAVGSDSARRRRITRAIEDAEALFRSAPGGGDPTVLVRKMRDERTRQLAR